MRVWCLFLGWAGLIVGGGAIAIGLVLLLGPGSEWRTVLWAGAVVFPSGVLFATLGEILGHQRAARVVAAPAAEPQPKAAD